MRPDPPRPEYPPLHTKPKRTVPAADATPKLDPNSMLRRQFGRPSEKDWYFFSLELRTLLEAGVPMIQALKLLETSSERFRVKRAAGYVASRLAQGSGLRSSLTSNRDLPALVQALLVMGHQSGRLTSTLDLIVRHYRWMLEVRSLLMKSGWYPASLVIMGAIIMTGREATIASMTGRMSTGEALLHFGIIFHCPIFVGMIAAIAVTEILKARRFRRGVDAFILTVPLLGGVIKKYAVGVFLEVLSACIEAGMPATDAYELAANSTSNMAIGERLNRWHYFLQDGETLLVTLRQTGVLDPDALAMVTAGEASGEGPYLMRRVADYYHDEIRVSTRMMISILTPIMLPAMAVAYYIYPNMLGVLAFVLVFLFRLI